MSQWIVTLNDEDSVRDLKEAGADELLVSVPFFSLRGAHIFPLEQLQTLSRKIHAAGAKLAVNCTRFFMEEELPRLREFLALLKDVQADTIYFADEGVLYEAAQLGLQERLVYQPDTLVTNSADVRFYREQGCKGVAAAREITLEEICAIAAHSSGLELLVHGRFSIMHSRRQLLRCYFDFLQRPDMEVQGRRDLFLREETRAVRMPVFEDESGTHVFSEYTLQSFAQIETLIRCGAQRFRIDSIFHDDAWSVRALNDYRAVLAHQLSPAEAAARCERDDPESCYSEGFYYTKTSLVK